ncbi:HWE histidine kinase domain-containing protein [Roseomonas populi]|uniref:histidine kinase n=1 Tax=Roseomonas populi TaxID=3121582 RepID=A0ABT1X865_9PROT|nr:HWE histidine kinase domain-containing protein [Roseomonas pecuniae]MCR0984291.1 PAS domain S-box protein [Roseomonas pecuniae]
MAPLPERHDPDLRIAELERENRALRGQLERLRRLLDSARNYAIIPLDLEGQVAGWNEGARAILGYEEGEILGHSGEVFFPAEDLAQGAFVQELCQALESGCAPNERWHLRRDGSRFWASGAMMPVAGEDGQPEGFLNIMRDNTAVQAAEERRALRMAEMSHRIRNTLANAKAIAEQTLQRAGVPRDVRMVLAGRLAALSRAHEMLLRGAEEGAPLSEVLARALSPYGGSGRARLEGPPVQLPADAVEMLGLAFHELATNAAKHGSLTAEEGRIEVLWCVRKGGSGLRIVEITWRERGGPPVAPPEGRGFGSRLLERGLTHDFGGTVSLNFAPEGLECHISLPLRGAAPPQPGR